jgi:hexosaminidase
LPGTKIYYTLDGSNPTTTSELFKHPFTLYLPAGKSLTLRCVEVTPGGNISVPYSAIYQHVNAQIKTPQLPTVQQQSLDEAAVIP